MKNTILITGHKGLIGSACVRHAKDKYEVLTMDFDIRNESLVDRWFRTNTPQYVINCAAKVGGVRANRDQPVDFLRDNLAIQSAIINASAEFGVEKLVSLGTSCLFPRDAPLPVREESLLTGPFDQSVQSYAIAKLAGYALCKAYHFQNGKNFTTACPSNIYGIGDNYGPSAHVIPALMMKLLESVKSGAPMTVWGDGTAIREFLYADDCASAIITVLEHWNKPDAINIGTGIGISIKELVDTIFGVTGFNPGVIWDDSQPTGIQNKTFDISKLTNMGWKPKIDFGEGLALTWKDLLSNPNPRNK